MLQVDNNSKEHMQQAMNILADHLQIFAQKQESTQNKYRRKFWTINVTMTFITAIQSFHKILFQFMMTYQQTKCGCKSISSYEEIEL